MLDNLCHTLAGAALGQAGLKGRTALGMTALLIGANLPDIDVLAIALGHSLDFRRGWTHGVLALVVLPFVLTGVLLAWDRWVRRRRRPRAAPADAPWLLALSFAAILSHPFLDWLNTYGMRWLMPFSGRWFYGDALFIIDVWVWIALGLGVFVSRYRQRKGRPHPWRPAAVAAAATLAYMVAMLGASAAGERWVRERLVAQGVGAVRSVMAGPVPLSPFRREVVVELEEGYLFGELRFAPGPELGLDPEVWPRGADHTAVALAREVPDAREFLVWSRFPVFRVEPTAEGAWVYLDDARYARPGRPSWAARRVFVPAALAGE